VHIVVATVAVHIRGYDFKEGSLASARSINTRNSLPVPVAVGQLLYIVPLMVHQYLEIL